MKYLFFTIVAASLVLLSCNNKTSSVKETDSPQENGAANSPSGAVITYKKNIFDFGVIAAGAKVSHEFVFTNTGTGPLIISNATATCGCTIPEYPKQPIAPGKEGVIKVIFDSAGKMGKQHKVITITSNTEPSISEVYLTGEVKGK
ncbi:MAG: DUF1573 domain-containing protein [Pyrinomonadaceae bacterium]|nr:DUF1573 domain-containing protein [Sphingobacteriaceae bacterium]